MKKLIVPLLLLMSVTQAHAIDLTRAPTPEEVSKMGAIELCYHAEVRDTAPLSSKLKSEGLQCAAILDSAKRIIGDRQKAEQAEANQKAERERRLAVTRKREGDPPSG